MGSLSMGQDAYGSHKRILITSIWNKYKTVPFCDFSRGRLAHRRGDVMIFIITLRNNRRQARELFARLYTGNRSLFRRHFGRCRMSCGKPHWN